MRMLFAWLATGMLLPAIAGADPIFFDDFSGNELGPHWSRSLPHEWGYQVANGLLTVNWLPEPIAPASLASIGTQVSPNPNDFSASLRIGWEPGQHRTWTWTVSATRPGHLLGNFRFDDRGPTPQLFIGTGATSLIPVATPPAGMHEFTMTRAGSIIEFFVNQDLVATLAPVDRPVGSTGFQFGLYQPGHTFEPVHVDWISIVPSPSSGALVLMGCALWAIRRRR